MASYPLTIPSYAMASIDLRARNAVAISQSPWTFSQQVIRHQGEIWEAEVRLPPMPRETAEQWVAFLLQLRGQTGTFTMGDPAGLTARGSASSTPGSPVVGGADQTGDTLDISGVPLSTLGYLKAGDYIQLGSGATATLHKVLTDVDTSGTGTATVELFPAIRTAPTNGSAITVANAVGNWRLSSSEVNWSINEATMYGLAFACMEAI